MSKLSSPRAKELVRFTVSSVFFSLVMCLIFSAFVKGLYLDEKAVSIGRTVIKIVSVLLAEMYAVRVLKNGAIKGALLGCVYCVVSFVLFSILSGGVDFSQFSLKDVFFCAIVGCLSGIIAVNVKK